MMDTLHTFVESRMEDWRALRRNLHNFPEIGFCEYWTTALLAKRLVALGYALRFGNDVSRADAMIGIPAQDVLEAARNRALDAGADPDLIAQMGDGQTGLVAELQRGDGPVVAMRFDIDALPIPEARDSAHMPHREGFASRFADTMHACGHDGHATIGIGVAEAATRADAQWQGTLRLIFQPAEEGGRGARPMVEAGIVDDADWFFALHLGCDLPSRHIACEASQMMFSAKWDVAFHGRAAHAAGNPENGRNALLAAAQAVVALHALPRHGVHATHVNVGRLEGGTARNVIADKATMQIELRSNHEDALGHLMASARALLSGLATAHGCTLDIDEMGLTIGGKASKRAAAVVGEVAQDLPGIEAVLPSWPLGGGDDAAFFVRRVQERGGEAVYLILGSTLAAGHHAVNFDFNEADIATGVRLMTRLLEKVGNTVQGWK